MKTSKSHSEINWPLKEENKALAKKVNTLQELDQQKEHRIVMFESKNNKLFKYIKSLDKTLKEAQQNITESKVIFWTWKNIAVFWWIYHGIMWKNVNSHKQIGSPQCYRQWLFKGHRCITLKIKIWVVAYFFNFFKLFQTKKKL